MEAKQTTDNSVFALISAFISGQDIFRKLKERKVRRRQRKEEKEAAAQQETRLGTSLYRGPVDIQNAYEQNFALHGQVFREGDAQAHASLAATLLKLNNGLVGIITQFLGNGKNKKKPLDYDALTILSETSRLETIDALSSLAYRLSHSKFFNFMRPSSKRKESDKKPQGKKSGGKKSSPQRSGSGGKQQLPLRQVQSSNVSSTQLALVRPRPKPRRSTSSGSGLNRPSTHGRSQSAGLLNNYPAPTSAAPARQSAQTLATPPITPRTSLQTPREQGQQKSVKSRLARSTPNLLTSFKSSHRPVIAAMPPTPPDSPQPNITTPAHFESLLLSPQLPPNPQPTPATSYAPPPYPPQQNNRQTHRRQSSSTNNIPNLNNTRPPSTLAPPGILPSQEYSFLQRPHHSSSLLPRRHRTTKSVASSMRTFASGSTKLGEIPQHKLAAPFDYAEMARLNASAALIASTGGGAGQRAGAVVLAGGGGGGTGRAGFWTGLFGKRGKRGVIVG